MLETRLRTNHSMTFWCGKVVKFTFRINCLLKRNQSTKSYCRCWLLTFMDYSLCSRTPTWTDSSSSARRESWTSRYRLPPTSSTAWRSEKRHYFTAILIYCELEKNKALAANHFYILFMLCVFYIFPPFSSSNFSTSSSLLRLFSTLPQGLLSMERIPVIIRFLPVLFNQLFKVLTQNDNDEVTTATTR